VLFWYVTHKQANFGNRNVHFNPFSGLDFVVVKLDSGKIKTSNTDYNLLARPPTHAVDTGPPDLQKSLHNATDLRIHRPENSGTIFVEK